MVIDFHAHVYEEHRAPEVVADVCRRAGIPAYADGTVHGLRRSMDEAGIDVSVISRITTRPDQVDAVNRWLASLNTPRTPAAATVHPELSDLADRVEPLRRQGFTGFKVHPDYQGFYVDEPRMFSFYEAAQAADMWILFHAGLDRGLPGAEVHGSPERLLRVHRAFPRLAIVAAHMGGEEIYDETERLLLGRDVYLDTSFVLRKMDEGTLRRFLRRHDPERILFGTDSPWGHQGLDVRFFRSLAYLGTRDRERMMGGNAARLLRVPRPDELAAGAA